MTRKDKFFIRGLWFLCLLICVQSAFFMLAFLRIRKEREKIETSARLLASACDTFANASSRASPLESVHAVSRENSSLRVFPYTELIGVGRTKSSKGRLMFYRDYRTYTTNGVFTTHREYTPTPFFKTNATPERVSAGRGR